MTDAKIGMAQLLVSLQYDQPPEGALGLRLFHVVGQLLRPGLKAALTARLIHPPAVLNAGDPDLRVQLSIRHPLKIATLPESINGQYNPVHEVYELAGSLTSLTKGFQVCCPGCTFASTPSSCKDQVQRALSSKHTDPSTGLICSHLSHLAHGEVDFLQILPKGCPASADFCHQSTGSREPIQPPRAGAPGCCCEGHTAGSTDAVVADVEPHATRLMAVILANITIHIISATAGQTARAKQRGPTDEAQQLLPWRAWAIHVLTEDVDLIHIANWARPSFTDLLASLSAMTTTGASASTSASPAATAFKPIHLCPQSLLDTVLAPPWVAVSEPHAFETTSLERVAVLLKHWHGWLLQHQPEAAAATAAAVSNLGYLLEQRKAALQDLWERLLALDPAFSTLPDPTRLPRFLQCAGISGSIDQVMVKLDKILRTKAHITSHVEACAHCGLPPSKLRALCKASAGSGGSKKHVNIMCKCSHCLVTMCVPCVRAAAGRRDPAEETPPGSVGDAEAAEAAACWPGGLCYWCAGAADILQARAAARSAAAPVPAGAVAVTAPLAGNTATPLLHAPAAGVLQSQASMQIPGPTTNSTPLHHQQPHQEQESHPPPQPQQQEPQQHRRQQQHQQQPAVFSIPSSRSSGGANAEGSNSARFSLSHGTHKRPTQLLPGQHNFLRPSQKQQLVQSPQQQGQQGAPDPAPLQLGFWCSEDMDACTGSAGQQHCSQGRQQQQPASQQRAAPPGTAYGCAAQPPGPSAVSGSAAGPRGEGQQQQQVQTASMIAHTLAALPANAAAAQMGKPDSPAARCLDINSSRVAAAGAAAGAAQAAGCTAAATAAGPGTQGASTVVHGCTALTVGGAAMAHSAPLQAAAAPVTPVVGSSTAAAAVANMLGILLVAARGQAVQHDTLPAAAPAAITVRGSTCGNLSSAQGQQGSAYAEAAAPAPSATLPAVSGSGGNQLSSTSCPPLLQALRAMQNAGIGSNTPGQAAAAGASQHSLAPPAPQPVARQPAAHAPAAPAVLLPAQHRLAATFAADCQQQHSTSATGADDAVRDVQRAGTPSSSAGLADALQTALRAAASRLAALPAQDYAVSPEVSAALQDAASTAATAAEATGAAMVGAGNMQPLRAGALGEVQHADSEACRKFMTLVQALVSSGGSFATQAAGTLALGVAAGAARFAEVRGHTPQPAATHSGPARGSKGSCSSSNIDDAASQRPRLQHKQLSRAAQPHAAAAQPHASSRVLPVAAAATSDAAGADSSDYEPGAAERWPTDRVAVTGNNSTSALQYLTEDEQLALSTLMDLGHVQQVRQGTRRRQQQRHPHPRERDQGLQPAAGSKKQHEQLLDQLQQQSAQGCWLSASVVGAWEQHYAPAAGAGLAAAATGNGRQNTAPAAAAAAAAAAVGDTDAAQSTGVEANTAAAATAAAPEAAQLEQQLGLVKLLQALAAGNSGQLQSATRGIGCVAEAPAVSQQGIRGQLQPGCVKEANTSSAAGAAAPTTEPLKRKRVVNDQSHAEPVLTSPEPPALRGPHLYMAAQNEQQQQRQQEVVPAKRYRSSTCDDYMS